MISARQPSDDSHSPTPEVRPPSEIRTSVEFGEALMALTKGRVRGLSDAADVPRSTLSGWATGQHLPNPNQMSQFRRLLTVLGVDAAGQSEWEDAALRARRAGASRRDDSAPPYLGLTAFDVDDADRFRGRDELVVQLSGTLAEAAQPEAPLRLVAVVGASGAGKSSLLRAGLVPRIVRPEIPGIRSVVVTTPKLTPRGELIDLCAVHGASEGGRGVVVVDQLEELFTGDVAEADAMAYLRTVTDEASSPIGPVVVVGVRADFYQRVLTADGFESAMQQRQLIVVGMTATELREAIVEPARQAGVSVEDDLVTLIVDDLCLHRGLSGRVDPGSLPLLSHALRETWVKARQNVMRVSDYLELGGLRGALERSAEAAFNAQPAEDLQATRDLFRRLVSIDADGRVARRRVDLNDLPHDATTNRVLVHFVQARLLYTEESTVTLAHEILLEGWQRLRDWVADDRADMALHRDLREACEVWRSHQFDTSTLAVGGRLDRLEEWATTPVGTGMISPLETDFLDASRRHADELAVAERRQRRRLGLFAGAASALAVVAVASTAVAVSARNDARTERNQALARKVALQADQISATDPALGSQLALIGYQLADTVESRSALLDRFAVGTPQRFLGGEGATALAAAADAPLFASTNAVDASVQLYRQDDTGASRWKTAVNSNLPEGTQLFAAALSADGTLVAAGGTNGYVTLWRVNEGEASPTIEAEHIGDFDGGVQALAFDASGTTLNIAGPRDAVQRFDLSDPTAPRALTSLAAPSIGKALAYSPDERLMAVGGTDGVLRIFDVTDDAAPLIASYDPVREGDELFAIAFDPAGDTVALGYRSSHLQMLSVADDGTVVEIEGPASPFTSWVNAIAFSADGSQLYAGSSDATLRGWRTDDWTETQHRTMPGPVTGVAALADGEVVTTSFDGTTRVWPTTRSPFAGPRATVFNIYFSGDGGRLGVFPGGRDGTIEVWDTSNLPDMAPLADRIPGPPDNAYAGSGTMSRDGELMYAGTESGSVAVVDLGDPATAAPRAESLDGLKALTEFAVVNRDGTRLVAGGDDGQVGLWDITDPGAPTKLANSMATTELAYGAEFHPTLPIVAVASSDDSVYLWRYEEPTSSTNPIVLSGFENDAVPVAFSDDGKYLAVGSSDRTVRVWNVSDPAAPEPLAEPLTGPQGGVFGLDFQPGTHLLGGAAQDGSVWLWDLTDPDEPFVYATLKAAQSKLNTVAFSADGQFVIASGAAGRLFVWATDPSYVTDALCSAGGDGITPDEQARLLPEVTASEVCS